MSTQRGRSRKKMKNTYKPRIIALACLLVLAISAAIGGGLAKYTERINTDGPGQTFVAALVDENNAGKFALTEKLASMEENGDFVTEADEADGNSYFLIPGTVIPKNPQITLTNKTDIPAYLYLKVEGKAADANVVYAIDSSIWTRVKTEDNALIYTYTKDGIATKLPSGDDVTFGILENDQVVVASLKKLEAGGELAFTGYLIQAPGEQPETEDAALEDALTVWDRMDGSNTYLVDTTIRLANEFEAGVVTAKIDEPGWEESGHTEKETVRVQNTGNVPALIRAKLIVNWLDAEGNIVANPTGVTDPVVYNDSDWTKIFEDEAHEKFYYYYNDYVAAGDYTKNLIDSTILATSGGDYQLQVEVIAEAIQATGQTSDGESAVHSAWGHDFNGTDKTWN